MSGIAAKTSVILQSFIMIGMGHKKEYWRKLMQNGLHLYVNYWKNIMFYVHIFEQFHCKYEEKTFI